MKLNLNSPNRIKMSEKNDKFEEELDRLAKK